MARIKELAVNGSKHPVDADDSLMLLGVLRDDLGLTGTKYGCGEGQCGACTVLIEGSAVKSCVTPLSRAAGRHITTIEGLASNGRLHPVQQAFLDAGALQCGYCTPGMIMAGAALLSQNPRPSEQQILQAMEGNICRCGTYPRIVRAIAQAAKSNGRAR
jgi:aerobic-type carbon monoxide dehydrogenase small subunit (CoxS/CutS family)